MSNLAMIWLGWLGVRRHARLHISWSVRLCFLTLALVGIGSLGFHATLLYEMQLVCNRIETT